MTRTTQEAIEVPVLMALTFTDISGWIEQIAPLIRDGGVQFNHLTMISIEVSWGIPPYMKNIREYK